MNKAMRIFLDRAASATPGKGIFIYPEDRRIAGKAVSLGYGMKLGITGFAVFVISDEGKEALSARKSGGQGNG